MKKYTILIFFMLSTFSVFSQDDIIVAGGTGGKPTKFQSFSEGSTAGVHFGSFHSLVNDYKDFVIEQAKSGALQDDANNNIYLDFALVSREMLDRKDFKNLYHYWQTDLATPAKFDRYQRGEFNWGIVRHDIEEAKDAINETRFFPVVVQEDAIYKHQDQVYFNPYNKEEVWLKDNSYLDMETFRQGLVIPSMVGVPMDKIDSDYYRNIKELNFKPQSFHLDKMMPAVGGSF
ncbi:MAG: hypothetical protein OXB84_04530 [Halobacteriovoraceae bacterium]|nr:hypothetical protein [Halobacteriovoraceae bacterium]